MSRSKLQQEVLSLYRCCLRAAKAKPGFEEQVRIEFRKHASLSRTDTLHIEHLLRQGHRKLKMMRDPHVDGMRHFMQLGMSRGSVFAVRLCGQVDYRRTWLAQRRLAAVVAENIHTKYTARHIMLLLEHKPVYTVGIRASEYTAAEEARLRQSGADFVRTNRGGLITFHGPGQLTVYPILNLPALGHTLKWYVSALELTVIRACLKMGLETHTSPYTGVWVNDTNKICAIGVQGRRVTTHGLALNCNTDLSWFDRIVPCGIENKGVTSLSRELNRTVTVDEAVPHFLKAFSEVFECNPIICMPSQLWTLAELENVVT